MSRSSGEYLSPFHSIEFLFPLPDFGSLGSGIWYRECLSPRQIVEKLESENCRCNRTVEFLYNMCNDPNLLKTGQRYISQFLAQAKLRHQTVGGDLPGLVKINTERSGSVLWVSGRLVKLLFQAERNSKAGKKRAFPELKDVRAQV